jgi:hypothetical protein
VQAWAPPGQPPAPRTPDRGIGLRSGPAGEPSWGHPAAPGWGPGPAEDERQEGARPRRRALVVLVLVVVVLLVGGLATAVLLSRAPDDAGALGSQEGEPGGPGQRHGPVPVGQAVTFDDQLELQVVSLRREKAGTRAEKLVLAEVEVTNRSNRRMDLFLMEATARLGPEQRAAPRFSGASGSSERGAGTLPPGAKATVTFAFQLERTAEAGQVTLEIWPDWAHGPALFQGRVA